MNDWYVMGKGIGMRPGGSGYQWIYWVPGQGTQEGEWSNKELWEKWGISGGIRAWHDNMRRHPPDVLEEMKAAGLVDLALAEVERRLEAKAARGKTYA